MKISDFVANVSAMGGLATTNRFTAQVNLPNYVLEQLGNNGNSIVQEQVLMFCESTQLPGVNLNTAQTRTFGEVREMPYETNYEPITVSFYVDSNFLVKQIFDAWTLGIQDWDTRNFRYYKDYTRDFTINVQNLEDNTKYKVVLYEAYPKTISAISMAYDSKDVMKISVSLMYKYWRSYTTSDLIMPVETGTDILYPQTKSGSIPSWAAAMGENWFYSAAGVMPENAGEYTGEVYIDP